MVTVRRFPSTPDPLACFRPWFYTAAAYNLLWGSAFVLAPGAIMGPLGMGGSRVAWQVVGMMVLVYAPAYWCVARAPSLHADLVAVAVLGKTSGVLGFTWAAALGRLPLLFGLTILTNDVIWLPAFGLYLRRVATDGGPRTKARGELPAGDHASRRAENARRTDGGRRSRGVSADLPDGSRHTSFEPSMRR